MKIPTYAAKNNTININYFLTSKLNKRKKNQYLL